MGSHCDGRVKRHRATGVETLKTALASQTLADSLTRRYALERFTALATTLGKFVAQ
ncbi:hypothetical protein [Nostoc sp.]|uniref:hypothetical protein n=1 Tax=Nostoc sp. TaxID=1180 RepID=UPI002FF490E0